MLELELTITKKYNNNQVTKGKENLGPSLDAARLGQSLGLPL